MPNGRTLEQAEKQIAALVEENKRLAAELEDLQASGAALDKATRDALAAKTASERQEAAAKSQLEASQRQVTELRQANATLTASVSRLNRQVEKSPLNPLTVEEATNLFESVVAPFRASDTLEIRNVSLNLKLATGKIGDVPVLLVPDPKSVDPALLHELTLDMTSKISKAVADSTPVPVRPIVTPRRPTGRPLRAKAAAKPTRAARRRG
jgi:predicted RNase H-like nuclease (RuvC/YqgF family)